MSTRKGAEQPTVIAQKKLVPHTEDSKRSQGFSAFPFPNKVQRGIGWVKEALRVQCLEIDDLEAIRAADA